MPQKGRGGKRVGAPGQAYPNRTDMAQAPRAVPGQPYGTATQQLNAQQALPLPATPTAQPAPQPAPDPAANLPAIGAPTQRPNEPLTHGLPTGPGAGPEVLGGAATANDDNLEAVIRGYYQLYPNSDIAKLVAQLATRRQ